MSALSDKLLVTINTDDPKMFGSSLAEEYRQLVECLGFSRVEIQMLIQNAIRASWLPPERKQLLAENFKYDPAWQET